MAEQLVGKASDFKDGEIADGDVRLIKAGREEIGVIHHKGKYYAYRNLCPHQGGPACEGLTIAKVEEHIMPDKTSRGMYFSETEMHFVCPWHGYEFHLADGCHVIDRKLRLKKYEVVQRGGEIFVAV